MVKFEIVGLVESVYFNEKFMEIKIDKKIYFFKFYQRIKIKKGDIIHIIYKKENNLLIPLKIIVINDKK